MLDGRVSVDQEFCDFDERRRFSDCLYGEENAGVHGTFEAIDVVVSWIRHVDDVRRCETANSGCEV